MQIIENKNLPVFKHSQFSLIHLPMITVNSPGNQIFDNIIA